MLDCGAWGGLEWGDVATWLSAFGTIAATGVALWLALRPRFERLTLGFGLASNRLDIFIVNASDRPIAIEEIEFKLGRWGPPIDAVLDFLFSRPMKTPAVLQPRQAGTFGVHLGREPSDLPYRLNHEHRARTRLDRALFLIVTTGERRQFRYRVPRAVVAGVLEMAPRISART